MNRLVEPDAVLLDFDGPIAAMFSGRPSHVVARVLRTAMEQEGVALPARFAEERDPLRLLRWVGQEHPQVTHRADRVLTEEETCAARTARPTRGSHELVRALATSDIPVAIVSNNSARAIQTYLDLHDLARHVVVTCGRPLGQPERMKPAPDLLLQAAEALGTAPGRCVFVGDSPTDVEAARAAGMPVVGYVKSDRHRTALWRAEPDRLIDRMDDLTQEGVAPNRWSKLAGREDPRAAAETSEG